MDIRQLREEAAPKWMPYREDDSFEVLIRKPTPMESVRLANEIVELGAGDYDKGFAALNQDPEQLVPWLEAAIDIEGGGWRGLMDGDDEVPFDRDLMLEFALNPRMPFTRFVLTTFAGRAAEGVAASKLAKLLEEVQAAEGN